MSTNESRSIEVDLELRSPASYASYHNHIPVVSELTVWNRSDRPESDVKITISGTSLTQDFVLRIDGLGPYESRALDPVDLPLSHDYLASLNEAETQDLIVTASVQGRDVYYDSYALELLSYDQWGGIHVLPELLAAFCTPNDSVVDTVLAKAGRLLATYGRDGTMKGYQAEDREDVWYQMSAIYSVLAAEKLVYVEAPRSFTDDGQKIRLPERIFSSKVATCLDTTMLFASCLEQAGLHPLVLIKQGHAWVGCWLIDGRLPTPVTDDCQSIRKRVQNGEIIVFETTGIASANPPWLKQSVEQGKSYLEQDQEFMFAVDIERARDEKIRPIPDRWKPLGHPASVDNEPSQIETMPSLPPILDQDKDYVLQAEVPGDSRLKRWKGKLLDLTTRNRLLNFKVTRTIVPLLVSDLETVENALADGKEWRFRSIFDLMPAADPRSLSLAVARTGVNPHESIIVKAMKRRELVSSLDPEDLTTRLLNVFRAGRTSLEEGGANTLFLTIGMLYWKDGSRSRTQPAPILLVPVSLSRKSTRSGFSIARHDDETVVNPTLLQLLRDHFQLDLKGLEVIPEDEHGVDVAKIMQMLRTAVTEIPGFEVRDEVHLGLLSYAKYLMWRDLEDRPQDLRQNRVVARLMDTESNVSAPAGDENFAQRDDIDERHEPWELLTPLDADSSQMNAISRAAAGHDLVLEGPPGTGKSQTITNLIAHFLGSGKSILFVSEKMAALDVVHRRLSDVGLGPFCLELHSAKSKKTDVLEQLGSALNGADQYPEAEWREHGKKLAHMRRELNVWVDTLHRKHPNGLTVRDAMGTLTRFGSWRPARLSWEDPDGHNGEDLAAQRELMQKVAGLLGDMDSLVDHPLRGMCHTRWTTAWEDALSEALDTLGPATESVSYQAMDLLKTWGFQSPMISTEALLQSLHELSEVMATGRDMPQSLLRALGRTNLSERLRELIRHGKQHTDAWNVLSPWFRREVSTVSGEPLKLMWTEARTKSAIGKWLSQRRVLALLKPFAVHGVPKDSLDNLLDALESLNRENLWLEGAQDGARDYLGPDIFRGPDTDWLEVENVYQWSENLEESARHLAHALALPSDEINSRIYEWIEGAGQAGIRESRPRFVQYGTSWEAYTGARMRVADLIESQELPRTTEETLDTIRLWVSARTQWALWCRWRELRADAFKEGLGPLMAQLEAGAFHPHDLEDHWAYSYQYWWFRATIDREDKLRQFTRGEHLRHIAAFKAADAEYREITGHYLVCTLAERLPRGELAGRPSPEMKILLHELNKKRAHWPVRKLIRALPTLLPKLKPCLLMSPLSVAQYLDANARFDVVIFDEASQIPVWDAVGAIARGNQLVVVGDPKQLPPTSFFEAQDRGDDLADGPDEDLESILDECLGSALPTLRLEWHYRSRHESLIAFSNHKYYDSKLVTFPSAVTRDTAVSLKLVSGTYDRGGTRTNLGEASAVVEAIAAHFQTHGESAPTIGVVTFNLAQQQLIEGLLDQKMHHSPELEKLIMQSPEPLFVKNLENVQGDERDLIFFSVTYGRDDTGRIALNMGPLNKDGGHRRLNVAITRARQGVTIFSTIKPEDIDGSRTRARGVLDLKDYLRYAQVGLYEGSVARAHTGIASHPIEDQIATKLEQRGWTVSRNIGTSVHRIDIGVVDPRDQSRFLLGVESDGMSYRLLPSARDRDRLHEQVLAGLHWDLDRIWSLDWVVNSPKELDRIENRLRLLLKTPVSAEALKADELERMGDPF